MKSETAFELLGKYVHGETLLRHCKTVGVVMHYFAEKYGEDAEYWESVGILHDIDFELAPDAHCTKCLEIFDSEKTNYPEIDSQLVHAVQSHGWNITVDVKPEHIMEKVLYTVDELTGLIFACAMARPSKSVTDMEVKSVTKKFKALNFAAGCNREVIKAGAELMGVELKDVIQDCILAMRTRHEEIGC
ncbi:MAG: hydrolase [Treponema sp.]|nr:hydrolase [Treponema sp.]